MRDPKRDVRNPVNRYFLTLLSRQWQKWQEPIEK